MVPQSYGGGEVSGLERGFVRDLVAIRMEGERRDFSGGIIQQIASFRLP